MITKTFDTDEALKDFLSTVFPIARSKAFKSGQYEGPIHLSPSESTHLASRLSLIYRATRPELFAKAFWTTREKEGVSKVHISLTCKVQTAELDPVLTTDLLFKRLQELDYHDN